MTSTEIMRQIEKLKKEKANNDSRIAQEQRSAEPYERRANDYQKEADQYTRKAESELRKAEPYRRKIRDLENDNSKINRQLDRLEDDYRRQLDREKRK